MKDFEFLKRLSKADGIPGSEDEVRSIISKELKPYVDRFEYDRLGSIIGVKKGEEDGLKIAIFGHMDEVGFVIKSIDNNGFLRVFPLGAWNPHIALGIRVTVTNRHGEKFIGILTTDKSTKDLTIDDLYIEIGCNTKEEIDSLSIREGDMVTPYEEVEILKNNNILGKAWDNRLGCAVMVEAIKRLKNNKNNLYGVGTVQEEAGTRGGGTSVAIVKPDLAIVVDIATSKDTPNLKGKGRIMGQGPSIVFLNKMAIMNKKLYNRVIDIAEENNIKVQFDILNGGTDSGPIHLYDGGVPIIEIIIPIRNAHSKVSIFNYDDYENTIKLVTKIVESMNVEELNKLIRYK